jgi:hypothetical protein
VTQIEFIGARPLGRFNSKESMDTGQFDALESVASMRPEGRAPSN